LNRKRRIKIGLITLAVCVLLLAGAWVWRAPLLRGAAHLWIVSDAPSQADAIVILGGGLDTRPAEAARLYHRGLAPRILVMQPDPSTVEKLGLIIDHAALTRRLLEIDQVPAEAIIPLEPIVTSTFEEANLLAAWAKQNNAHRFLVPTELFHTRRQRWILRRQLQPLGVDVQMIALNHKKYTADDWWQTEEGLIDFENEAVKFAMYLCRY
jgi:uncharacterized SAM-binding protein YcdF (DUF218 family)